jgi:hypothetical protein
MGLASDRKPTEQGDWVRIASLCGTPGGGSSTTKRASREPPHGDTGSATEDIRRMFMSDAAQTPTQLLVQASVSGTMKVESRDGDNVGSVHAFMVHKGTGRATHAVLSLGGFLGMGKSFYPLPFALLQFDAVRDLYVVTIDKRVLEGGPSWANNAPVFDQAYADRVASYYGSSSEDLVVG